ncbi:histidine-type phosphatase [Legionella tunisiensis]|uniref:histidine-type phosphatase n=1 Tax=Legionella tunisiensis TaxID=1034944 RepID=UPI00036DACA8|nr:histidine-type phosphatase [Legionella tunisiensis]
MGTTLHARILDNYTKSDVTSFFGDGSMETNFNYASKTPYPARKEAMSCQPIPEGYNPIFTQLLARHGSRGLSSNKYDELTLQIWQQARKEKVLTKLGELLAADIQALTKATLEVGYGNLSQLGKQEQEALGERLVTRQAQLFSLAQTKNQRIEIVTSGKARAEVSADYFMRGMLAISPTLHTLFNPLYQDSKQLYFHKIDENSAYQNYIHHDPALLKTLDKIKNQPQSHKIAHAVLERLYTKSFVERLAKNSYSFQSRETRKVRSPNAIDAAIALYNLYCIIPAMQKEGVWHFERYIHDSEALWFAYLKDARDFYRKGPGFKNQTITYQIAKTLQDDFFTQVDEVISGNSNKVAKLRFAHAETVIPWVVLMQIPGYCQAVEPEEIYSYANNPWRGEFVSPFTANIQWDVYKNDKNHLIIRQLYNEKQIAFKTDCHPIAPGSLYYDYQTLLTCYRK